MYQLEVKHRLVQYLFPPSDGWDVNVNVDGMERGISGQQPPDKKEKAARAEAALQKLGVQFGAHGLHRKVDVSARHQTIGLFLVEVEGKSQKQPEQKMYSALGQILLMMRSEHVKTTYALAVPDVLGWEEQIRKIPECVKTLLNIKCYLVSNDGVREFKA